MRLFIAIDVPENVKKELSKLQKEFYGLGKITLVKDIFHCTLKFLGEVHSNDVPEIKKKLSEIKFKPFKVKLGKLGAFPNENSVKVLWVGLEGKVNELQAEIEKALLKMFEKDYRFHAHITLARIKFLDDKIKFKDGLKIKLPGLEFNVDNFKLIRSKLSPYGPEYEDIGVYNLK